MTGRDTVIVGRLPWNEVLDTVTASTESNGAPVYSTWKPIGPAPIVAAPIAITQLQLQVAQAAGVPQQVGGISAEESPYKAADGHLVSLIAISFVPVNGDPYFAGVQVWFTGYRGSSVPALMADGTTSPMSFDCETTHETVTVTVVAMGANGLTADFGSAPNCSLTLDGVVSAPPAPTISQQKTALASSLGWQFGWNAINGLEGDTIDGYWIYRSSSSTAPVPPAGRFDYRKQTASNIGTYTFSDIVTGTYYYWISAVNTSGLESTLTSAAGHVNLSAYPATSSGDFAAPTSAYDGNESTSAYGYDDDTLMMPQTITYSGWTNPSGGTPTAVTLKILTDVDKYIGYIDNGDI